MTRRQTPPDMAAETMMLQSMRTRINRAGLLGGGLFALLAHFVHNLDGVGHHLVLGHALKLRITRVLVEDRGKPGNLCFAHFLGIDVLDPQTHFPTRTETGPHDGIAGGFDVRFDGGLLGAHAHSSASVSG